MGSSGRCRRVLVGHVCEPLTALWSLADLPPRPRLKIKAVQSADDAGSASAFVFAGAEPEQVKFDVAVSDCHSVLWLLPTNLLQLIKSQASSFVNESSDRIVLRIFLNKQGMFIYEVLNLLCQ